MWNGHDNRTPGQFEAAADGAGAELVFGPEADCRVDGVDTVDTLVGHLDGHLIP